MKAKREAALVQIKKEKEEREVMILKYEDVVFGVDYSKKDYS